MNGAERFNLVTRNTEEIVTEEELRRLLEEKERPRAYWGFECSGLMHIGMGLVCGDKIRDMIKAGFEFIIFLADWHSWINNKLGGDMEKIRLCGDYFKDCFTAIGVDPNKVRYLWASDLTRDKAYWERVIRIAKSVSMQRIWRALPIMGRDMSLSDIEAAWAYYPCMQAADIFQMELDVACAGMDQRKAHMLARDVAEKHGWSKPVCVHTPLLMGLQSPSMHGRKLDENAKLNLQISAKMSKSIPESSVYIHDSPEEIKNKISRAYCPPKQTEENPILEHAKLIIFPHIGNLKIGRPEKYGGPLILNNYAELKRMYSIGDLHPLDLKNAVAEALADILKPVRDYFKRHPQRLRKMKNMGITR